MIARKLKDELIDLGFKPREDGFIGIKVQNGVWLEMNLSTKRTIIYSGDGKWIQIKHVKTVDRVKEIYKGLSGNQLIKTKEQ